MIPRSTYRLQLHKGFPFADAERIVPYLHELGISHIYASPITTARSGSLHGYDVVDPTRVNPELGGEEGLRRLVAALQAHDMGLIIDIVPNHMGVAGGENAWWNDVLEKGEASPYARFFDIDWSRKLLLPILGAPLDQVLAKGAIRTEGDQLLVYGEHRLPLRKDGGRNGDLAELLERQHYRLAWWRIADDELNWRRFFTVNELAGLRIEDPEVFEATHALYFRLYQEGLIDGLRVDHVDGLSDPGAYCRKLRERLDAAGRQDRAWIVVEKILGPGEHLPRNWGIDGTSGYDFMEQASALIHDPAGEAPLTSLWNGFAGVCDSYADEEDRARRQLLSWSFEGQLTACTIAFHRVALAAEETRGWTEPMIRRALRRLLWCFPVYRTYPQEDEAPDQPELLERLRAAANRFGPMSERAVHERILDWLAGDGDDELLMDAQRRFNQLAAPIAAKAVEDTAFYRYGRLLSRNDVGGDPARMALPQADFHRACEERQRDFPAAMLATATHDHKRGEDVRAHLAVLSGIPQIWSEAVQEWDELAGGAGSQMHAADRYMLYQTIFGAWPGRDSLSGFCERLQGWQQKALREAKLRSSWELPNQRYETRCSEFLSELMQDPRREKFRSKVEQLAAATSAAALSNSLVQLALRCLTPGVPDTYQGTELEDLSLVDPDNRHPVDFDARQAKLQTGTAGKKMVLLQELLTLRRDVPELFARGNYRPLEVTGRRVAHVLAFERSAEGQRLICAVQLRCASALYQCSAPVLGSDWWEDTAIMLDEGKSRSAADAFAASPVHYEFG